MTEENETIRAAGVRQTERQLAGASTAEIVKAAKSHEILSTYRVYTKEWLLKFRAFSEVGAQEYFAKKYEGRVKDDDWVITEDGEDTTWTLHVKLWNVKAEWKNGELANEHARLILKNDPDDLVEVVPRNSRKEHVLAGYGVLKLPDTKK